MIFVALMGVGLALAGQVWHTTAQRDKEKELLFVGEQFHKAIARFYEGSPGDAKKFPRSLEDLLDDQRYPTTMRHLRRIYIDPMTGLSDWGFITAPDGSIMGVHSISEEEPRKVWGFQKDYAQFDAAKKYSDWKFTYSAEVVAENQPVPVAAVPSSAEDTPTAAPTPETVEIPKPTPPSKDDPNRKRTCENFSRSDRGTCAFVRFRDGSFRSWCGTSCSRS